MAGFNYLRFSNTCDSLCMTHKSFESALVAISYLNETDDTLSANVCKALGLPSSKCYLSHLKKRVSEISSSLCSRNENRNTNDEKGSSTVPCQSLVEAQISVLHSDSFTTVDITNRIPIPRNTLSKVISALISEGKVEVIEQKRRPKVYRRIAAIRTDYLEAYIKAHNLTEEKNSPPQIARLFSVYVNRAYCGMSKPIVDVCDNVLQFSVHYDVRFPCPSDILPEERDSIDNLVLLIFNSGRDFRTVRRRLTAAIQFSEKTRKVLSKLTDDKRHNRLLNKYCLPNSIIHALSTEQGMQIFYESALHTLGGDISKKTVYQIIPDIVSLLQEKVEETTKEIESSTSTGSFQNTSQPYSVIQEQLIDSSIKRIVSCLDTPLKRMNVKTLYATFIQDFQSRHSGL